MNKITKGIFASFLVFAFVLVAAKSASAAYSHTTTLKMGSTGTQVMELQKALNAKGFVVSTTGSGSPGMESTYFGAKTKSAVMAFQTANGLTADGVVGPATGAKLAGTSTSGGGSTGLLCPNGMTLASNCTMAPGSTPAPQALCPNGMTLASNCTMAPGSTNAGPLQGGAGDALIDETSIDVENEVMEGATERVHGFRVEADGSDIQISNVKVALELTAGAGSNRLDRYATEVSVWDGNTKIGSSDVASFAKQSGSVCPGGSGTACYVRNISLNNAVVKSGSSNKKTFHVAITAKSNIDGSDIDSGNNVWDVKVNTIRFTDATGAILTSDYSEESSFGFEDLASSGDAKVRISLGANNPIAGNIEVSDTGSTSGVTMLEFKLKAEGTDVTFDNLVVNVTGTGATPAQIASELRLMRGSTTIADLTSLGSNGTKTFELYDDESINEGETKTYKVVAKINKIDNDSFDQGDSLKVDFSSVSAEDKNGDAVSTYSGSATGETQTFYSEGLLFTKKSGWTISTTTDTNGNITSATYTMKIGVTAFGSTFYVGQSAQAATTGSSTNAFTYWLEDSTAPSTAVIGGTKSATVASNASVEGSAWRLDEGTEREFTITVNLVDPVTASRSWRVQIGSMRTFSDSALTADAANKSLTPQTDYETAYQFINS